MDFDSKSKRFLSDKVLKSNLKPETNLLVKDLDSSDSTAPSESVITSDGIFSLRSYLSQIKLNTTTKNYDSTSPNFEKNSITITGESTRGKIVDKNERIQKLERSLNNIQSNVELKRSHILEDIYQKINILENKISEGETNANARLVRIGKKIECIEKSIAMVNRQQECIFKDKEDFMSDLCNRFNSSLSQEKENWKKAEKDTLICVAGQIESIKTEIRDIQLMKSEISSGLEFYINTEIPQIKARIENMNKKLETAEKIVGDKISTNFIALADSIRTESKKMDGIKREILLEVDRELERIRLQIRQECDEREAIQYKLVKLMEETIKRLGSPI